MLIKIIPMAQSLNSIKTLHSFTDINKTNLNNSTIIKYVVYYIYLLYEPGE